MEKIKPEVAGVKRVYNDGIVGFFCFSAGRTEELVGLSFFNEEICIHPNGKPKFRLVYKNTKLPTLK